MQENNFIDLMSCDKVNACTFAKLKIFLPGVTFMKQALDSKIAFGSLCLHTK